VDHRPRAIQARAGVWQRSTPDAAPGLKQVDIINEAPWPPPFICYVLGTEGLWFSELASEQRILVYDLGRREHFDLSLVNLQGKTRSRSSPARGDLAPGGVIELEPVPGDGGSPSSFNREFRATTPRRDPRKACQHLAWESRAVQSGSLTVRPKAALIVQHAGRRKTYQIETRPVQPVDAAPRPAAPKRSPAPLVDKAHKAGAAHLDLTVLSAGGSSRMPMIDEHAPHA